MKQKAALLLPAVLLLLSCGSGSSARLATPLPSGYYQYGDQIGLLQPHRMAFLDQIANPIAGNTDFVFVPLQGARGPTRLLDDGWVTDGRSVWCGKLEPEGKLSSWRSLGKPLYALGERVRYGCGTAAFHGENGETTSFKASDIQVLHCRTVRYRDDYFVQPQVLLLTGISRTGQLVVFDRLHIADPATFRLSPSECGGWDTTHHYTILPGDGQALRASENRGIRSGHSGDFFWRTDGNRIFNRDSPFASADPRTYTTVTQGRCPYGYDDQHVFFADRVIDGADVSSFVYLEFGEKGPCFAYDRQFRYRDGKRLRSEEKDEFEKTLREAEAAQKQWPEMPILVGREYPRFLQH